MLCSPISSERSLGTASFSFAAFSVSLAVFSAIVDLDQMGDDPDLPLQLRRVLALDGPADATQPERLQGAFLVRVRAIRRPDLLDRHGTHDLSSSVDGSSAASSAAGISAS